jgi:transcriptional regulator with XRE-family HTH domain
MATTPPNKMFGPLIRAKRLKRGFGLLELANLAGMDASLLSRMETGQRLPPELPGLVVLANKLGIHANSDEFSELLAAADQDRNPALHKMALEMRGGKSWNPFRQLEGNEVTCTSLGELVSKATQKAIEIQAREIAVTSPAGRTTIYRLQEGRLKRKKKS